MNGKMKHFSNITKRYFANDNITETCVYDFNPDKIDTTHNNDNKDKAQLNDNKDTEHAKYKKDTKHVNIEDMLTKGFADLNEQGDLIPGIVIGIMFLLKYGDKAHQIYEGRKISYESQLLKKFDQGLAEHAGFLTTKVGIWTVLKQTFNNLGFTGISCSPKRIDETTFNIDLSNPSGASMSLFLKFGDTDIKASTVTVTTKGCYFKNFFPVTDIAKTLFSESMDWIKATLANVNKPENSSVVAQNG